MDNRGETNEREQREVTRMLIDVRAEAGGALERLAGIGSWSWDVRSGIIWASPEWYRLHGLAPRAEQLTVADALNLIHPEDREQLRRREHRSPWLETGYTVEYRVSGPAGEERWIGGRGEVTEEEDGEVIRVTGYAQDITAAKLADQQRVKVQRELTHQQRVLERIARGAPLERTLSSVCRLVERRYPGARCSILLMDEEAYVLRPGASPSLPESFRRAVSEHPIGEGAGCCGTAAYRREPFVIPDMQSHPYTAPFVELAAALGLHGAASYPLIGSGGRLLGTFAVYRPEPHEPRKAEMRDVTATGGLAALAIEHDLNQTELTSAARRDGLTNLPNRARFLQSLAQALNEPGADVAVLFVDLDGFKLINDSLGHAAGDRILVEVARRLEAVVDGTAIAARFGGDEFTVMVRDLRPEDLGVLAERIQSALSVPLELDGGQFFLSASVGIAINDHDADVLGLIHDADAAMYAAKSVGLGQSAMFDAGLRNEALSRVKLEAFLRQAIDRHEFTMLYQPILDVAAGEWAGVEALARWNHPEVGMISPTAFIPLAEETGLIVPLGELILDLSIREAVALFAELPELPDLYLAVNVSMVQLHDPTLAATVAAALERHGLDPRRLVVEVTESAVMAEPELAGAVMRQITALGVRVLIDDFGMGHSSIARLGELPGSGVKIDKCFAEGVGDDPRAEKILAAIASLAHAHEHPVIAEGIESAASLAAIARLGCEYAQGFHLAMPMPGAALVAALTGPPPDFE